MYLCEYVRLFERSCWAAAVQSLCFMILMLLLLLLLLFVYDWIQVLVIERCQLYVGIVIGSKIGRPRLKRMMVLVLRLRMKGMMMGGHLDNRWTVHVVNGPMRIQEIWTLRMIIRYSNYATRRGVRRLQAWFWWLYWQVKRLKKSFIYLLKISFVK